MDTLSGSEDAYKALVDNAPEGWLLGLLAFAILEQERMEWMRHVETRSGCLPTSEQVCNWYEQQPVSALNRARSTAEGVLNGHFEDVSRSIDESYRASIRDGVVVAEIRSNNKFWPKFVANVAAGVVGAAIFSVLLVLIVLVAVRDPSPVGLIKNAQEMQSDR